MGSEPSVSMGQYFLAKLDRDPRYLFEIRVGALIIVTGLLCLNLKWLGVSMLRRVVSV